VVRGNVGRPQAPPHPEAWSAPSLRVREQRRQSFAFAQDEEGRHSPSHFLPLTSYLPAMTKLQVTTPEALPEETGADAVLRPSRLDEFIGQGQVKASLQIAIDAAKRRGESLDHTLFFGPPGLGKTTLAMLMAREMGVQVRTTSGPVLEKPGDLVGLLTSLAAGDILFIDEIHRLKPALEEFLYPAMEDFRVDVRIAEGPNAQTIPMTLEKFTLIGATTRFGLLTPPMRARFGIVERLGYYPADELEQIVTRSAGILAVLMDGEGAVEIARRSRGTPRVANRLLRRVRDYAEVKADGRITVDVASTALARLNVDEFGLDDMDARILTTIIQKFGGGPVGLGTVAVAVGEDAGTLQDVYEPYLIQQGFLERTQRGRCVTPLAYRRFGLTPPAGQATIFDA
jgi:Holliday junction DNA helicase RuvB